MRVLRVLEALGSSCVRISRVLDTLGGSFVRVLRVLEALGGSFVRVLPVWEAPGRHSFREPMGAGGSAREDLTRAGGGEGRWGSSEII